MTHGTLEGVAIRGIRACVPAASRSIEDDGLFAEPAERERLEKSIGVKARRIARAGLLTSDLCQRATERLLAQLGWEKDTIDVLLFVTQTSDYVIPSTACALQARLGLGNCMAFDINLGCSGYPYGLWTAASLLKSLRVDGRPARALVLAGDVSTARLLASDRSTVPLFGDAGTATALEADAAAAPMTGVFGTDGRGAPHILVEAGGLKLPLLPPEIPHDTDEAARLYKAARLHLNGMEVFNFTLKNVPTLIQDAMEKSGKTREQIDYFLLHQANLMMLKHLGKKSALSEEKMPVAMEEYGNTSSASIPLTIAARLSGEFEQARELMMVGFGVGWSWGAIQARVGPMPAPVIDEHE